MQKSVSRKTFYNGSYPSFGPYLRYLVSRPSDLQNGLFLKIKKSVLPSRDIAYPPTPDLERATTRRSGQSRRPVRRLCAIFLADACPLSSYHPPSFAGSAGASLP